MRPMSAKEYREGGEVSWSSWCFFQQGWLVVALFLEGVVFSKKRSTEHIGGDGLVPL